MVYTSHENEIEPTLISFLSIGLRKDILLDFRYTDERAQCGIRLEISKLDVMVCHKFFVLSMYP